MKDMLSKKKQQIVLPWAIDQDQATRLWSLSEELTGVPFRTSH